MVAAPPLGATFSTARLFAYTLLVLQHEMEVVGTRWQGNGEYAALGANPLIRCARLQGQQVIFTSVYQPICISCLLGG